MGDNTTIIRNADWVIAWDAAANNHHYLRNADVAFSGDTLTHVGAGYDGPADREIDGRGRMVMPGLVNIHCHPTSEPGNKGLLEELGSPRLGQSSLYEFMPVFRIEPEFATAASNVAMSELLKSGVTTVVDLSGQRPGWADDLAATGLRAFIAPMFRSAGWYTTDGHSVVYEWNEAAGEAGLEAAVEAVEQARKHPSGRLDGMLAPSQIDTCTKDLLQATLEVARERAMPVQIHAAQSVVEFNEITRRYGCTPIEWLDEVGLLGPNTIVSHGIYLNDHPWLHWPQARDFERLAESGAAVAHCPTVFARRGMALNWFSRYRKAGITMGLGTDTFPLNMIDEMRMGCYAARVVTGDYTACSTAEIFEAATVGGAAIVRRDDIGRLVAGAKADFSLVDMSHPYMQPVREPLRSLIYSASDRAIKDVYVGGEQVVRDGAVLTIDLDKSLHDLTAAQSVALSAAPQRDWASRSVDEMSPMVFPLH
ncbi:MAG: amidohydrolase family protein [Minwuiales bacterium]|nr:amidohydrolase family protein [Minwuiales bacterium]